MSAFKSSLYKSYSMPFAETLDVSKYPHLQTHDLFRFLKQLPPLDTFGPWVAGGAVWRAINNEPLNNCDIDIFFQSKSQYEDGCRKMNSIPYVNHVLNEVKNKYNTTYKFHVSVGKNYNKTINVQLIGTNFHNSSAELIDNFDFSVCQFVYDGKNFYCGANSLNDLVKKNISIHRIAKPKSMINHMVKYLNNGFNISQDQIKYLLTEIGNMDIWKKSAEGYDEPKAKETKKSVYEAVSDDEWAGFGYAPPIQREERPRRNRVVENRNENNIAHGQWAAADNGIAGAAINFQPAAPVLNVRVGGINLNMAPAAAPNDNVGEDNGVINVGGNNNPQPANDRFDQILELRPVGVVEQPAVDPVVPENVAVPQPELPPAVLFGRPAINGPFHLADPNDPVRQQIVDRARQLHDQGIPENAIINDLDRLIGQLQQEHNGEIY